MIRCNRKIFILTCLIVLLLNLDLVAEEIVAQYDLPPINRAPEDSVAGRILERAKVLRYTSDMPVRYTEVMDCDKYMHVLKSSIIEKIGETGREYKKVYFSGKTAHELNNFIKSFHNNKKVEIILTEKEINLDETINLRSFIIIAGSSTRLIAKELDIAIIGKDVKNTGVKELIIKGSRKCAIMFISVHKSIIQNISIIKGHDRGVVLRGGSSYIHFEHCKFSGNKRGGIMVQDGSNHIYIRHCEVSGGSTSSNWSAGIVITSLSPVSEYGIRDEFDSNYFFPINLSFKKDTIPFKNIIEASHIHDNQSSGIYIDGGNGNVLVGNYIVNNDKEGICLDFFSVGNIVDSNILSKNGFRKFQSDNDLKNDFVLHFGRLSDGSAVSKLPNISIDNAAYNIIIRNSISDAAGDGIKIVRSGFRNIIGLNSIIDNNAGENSAFYFTGILLGSAGIDVENDTSGIDALPSIENIIFGNTIYGNHKIGVLIDHGCVYNDIYDNIIMKQKGKFVVQQDHPNSIIGNNFNINQSNKKYKLVPDKKLLVILIISILLITVLSVVILIFLTRRTLREKYQNT